MPQNPENPTANAEHAETTSVSHHEGGSTEGKAPNKKDGKTTMFRRHRTLLITAGVIVAALLSIYFLRNVFLYEDTDDAQVDGHVMPLSSHINGQVLEINMIEGQLVHAGDILVVLDPRDYKVAADQDKANLADAKATASGWHSDVPVTSATAWNGLDSARTEVQNAQAGVQAAEHNLAAAQASLAAAKANAEKSDADLTRYTQLVAKEDISKQQYDQALAQAKANQAAVASAEAVVQADEQTVHQAEGKLRQAEADFRSAETAPDQVSVAQSKAEAANAIVEQRQAQLAQAELNLGYTIVRSPVTGIIGKKSAEVGQNVSIGQELAEVVPLNDIWVTANFKETQLKHMRPGEPVEIHVDAYGKTWKGHVTNLGGGTGSVFSLLPPENATGNYVKVVQRVPVRIDFDRPQGQEFNAEGILKPGLSVEPEVRIR